MAFPTGWGRKCEIIIPAAQISGDNTDFPLLVTQANLPTEMLDGGSNSALNGGGDVRFSEDSAGAVPLACQIVSFITGASPSAQIRVGLPTLNTGENKKIHTWYKKAGEIQPAVTAPTGRDAVRPNDGVVLNFTETDGSFIDSTGNGNTASISGTAPTYGYEAGVGNYVTVDDASYVTIPDSPDVDMTTAGGTISIRVKLPIGDGSWWSLFYKRISQGYFLQNWGGGTDRLFYVGGDGWNYFYGGRALVANDTWVTVTQVTDASDTRIYVNGNLELIGPKAAQTNEDTPLVLLLETPGSIADLLVAPGLFLSADAVLTRYRNESDPAAFASAGTPEAAGGGSSLTIQSGICGHITDTVGLTHLQGLAVVGGQHSHKADAVALSQGQSLSIDGGDHVHVADNSSITQNQLISVDAALNAATSDQVALSHLQVMSVADVSHDHIVDNASIAQGQALVVDYALQAHVADVVELSQGLTLSSNGAGHSLQSDNVDQVHFQTFSPTTTNSGLSSDHASLSQFQSLDAHSGAHSLVTDQTSLIQGQMLSADQTAHIVDGDEVTLSQLMGLAAVNATHGLSSDRASIFNPADLMASAERTLTLPRESRTYILPAENRTLRI